MADYIRLGEYSQDDRVQIVTKNNEVKEGRVLRITPHKDNYAIVTILPDDKEEIEVVQYKNKINKL